jgi:hypothetical protein
MLDRPSDDEVSRQILGIFMRHRIPATGILQRNDFFDVRDGDFQRGLNKAVANNWITVDLRNRYRYQLTATGYAVGRTNFDALSGRLCPLWVKSKHPLCNHHVRLGPIGV